MNFKSKSFSPILLSIILIFGIFLGKKISKKSNINQLDYLNQIILNNYVDSINSNQVYDQIFEKIISDLDPHSSYISKNSYKKINENMQGSFSGIGIEFSIIRDTVVVVSPISGGPSQQIGINAGDKIVNVNNERICSVGINNDDVIRKLRGEKGTIVNVDVYKPILKKIISYKIKRDNIPLVSVDTEFMINDSIGYIKINRFSATTFKEFNLAVKNLKNFNLKKLILDLRGNPGGFLDAAINIANQFFEKDFLLVYTEGNQRRRKDYYSNSKGELKNCELIILVDEGSASASEIIAGSVQDNDRGKIIGRKTFGKGLVQEEIKLQDGSVIRLTTQRYYTPSGRFIQKPYKSSDTIRKNNYFTKKGRPVFANGGITPDLLIPIDSSLDFSYINFVTAKGWLQDFCFDYASFIRNRENYLTEDDFESIINTTSILRDFTKKYDPKIYELKIGKIELEYLQNLIVATVGKNLFGYNFYYKTLLKNDEFIIKSINQF